MSFCSNCGNPIRPEARFCECCGAKISAPAAANPEDASACFLTEGNAAAASSSAGFSSGETRLAEPDSLFADPDDFPDDTAPVSSVTSAAPVPEASLPQAPAKGPIWLTAKPEEPPEPKQPFFATGPDAAYHAPAESIPMPAAPVPNVPIWMSQKTDLPEDLDGLTIDDIDPQEKSPIDEVSWLAKRSGPIPPRKG